MGDQSLDHAEAVRLLLDSDPGWRPDTPDDDRSRAGEHDLMRVSQVLSMVVDDPAPWLETVNHPHYEDAGEIEVRVLGRNALYLLSTSWSAAGREVMPTARIVPLAGLQTLEVDGFQFDDDDRPIGCTIALRFASGDSVRLGASAGADRVRLAGLVPVLRARLGV